MSKIDTQPVASLTNEQAAIALLNSNYSEIETKSNTFLSRDGVAPNEMLADLDMNSFHMINLPTPNSAKEPLRLQDLSDFIGGSLTVNTFPNDATYLVLSNNATMTAERVLTAGNGITFTDAGAGNTLTINSVTIPAALTRTNDTNVTITLGGTPTTALLQNTSLTVGWSGTLAAGRGGFGADVSASSGVPLFATGTPTFTSTSGTGNFVRVTTPTLVTPILGAATGTSLVLTGTSSSIIATGRQGSTDPVFAADASAASVTTGVKITGTAAGSRSFLTAISSGTNEGLSIDAKGSGTVRFGSVSTGAIEFSRNLVPTASDGAALGTSSLMFSDLFLASGSVINWNASDLTLTHASNVITLAGGDLAVPDDVYGVGWNGSANVPTKNALYDKIETITSGTALGSTISSFSVHKNSTDQTGVTSATYTQITFSTEIYDVGSQFASNAWTPTAGKVHLNAQVQVGGTLSTSGDLAIAIYKNGAAFRERIIPITSTAYGTVGINIDDVANGTDVYTVFAQAGTSSGTVTFDGRATRTWFSGHLV